MSKTKICTKCKRELPSTNEYFFRRKTTTDGFHQTCKECEGFEFKDRFRPARQLTQKCSKCGNTYPATTEYFSKSNKTFSGIRSQCKKCQKKEGIEYRKNNGHVIREWLENNKESVANKRKIYAEMNRERILLYQKYYYNQNRYRLISNAKVYRELNHDATVARAKDYYNRTKHLEHTKALKKISKHKRRAKEKELISSYSDSEWTNCKIYFNNQCAYCGKETDLQQDHFIPLSKGGEYTSNNIVPACKSCNSSKRDKDFLKWYRCSKNYSKDKETKILKYLNYDNKTFTQQLSLLSL